MTRIKYSFYNTQHGEKIRYIFNKSKSKIVIIFLHGMMSDIQGKKVKFLSKFCKKKHINFLTFDLLGHGKSSGKFADYGVNDWSIQANEIISNKIKTFDGIPVFSLLELNLLARCNRSCKFCPVSSPTFYKDFYNNAFGKLEPKMYDKILNDLPSILPRKLES